MTLEISHGLIQVTENGKVLASIKVFRYPDENGPICIADLEGTGSIQALRMIQRVIKEITDAEVCYLAVYDDNPIKDHLMKFYERLGARKMMTMYTLGGN